VIVQRISTTAFPSIDAVRFGCAPAGPDVASIYLHARYYDSALGIFLSPDPISADSNTYRYAGADPVNFTDPSGLCRQDPPTGEWKDCIFPVENSSQCSPVPRPGCPNYDAFSRRRNPFRGPDLFSEGFEDTFFTFRDEVKRYFDEIRENWRTRFGTGNDKVSPCGGKPCGPVKTDPPVTAQRPVEAAAEKPAEPQKPMQPCNAGSNYGDANITVISPWWVGVSFGVQTSAMGTPSSQRIDHPYIGLALGTPGVNGTSQVAPWGSTSPGLNVAVNYAVGLTGLVRSASHGYGAVGQPGGGRFHEVGGGGGTPGANVSFTWVFNGSGLSCP